MKTAQLLYHLVHQLTPDEKLYLDRLTGKQEDRLCNTLIGLLTEMKTPNEDELEFKWLRLGGRHNKKALENTKFRTKEKLLQAIHLSMAGAYPNSAETALKLAEAFSQKQLFQEAYYVLEKCREKQGDFISPIEDIQMLHKMLSLIPLVVKNDLEVKHTEILNECHRIVTDLQLYHQVHQFNHQVGLLYMTEANRKEEMHDVPFEQVQSTWETLNKVEKMGHVTATYFLKTTVMFMQLRYDFEQQAKAQVKLASIMQPLVRQYKESPFYVKFISEQINAGIVIARTGDENAFNAHIDFLFQVLQEEHPLHHIFRTQVWFIQTLYYYYRGDVISMKPFLNSTHQAFLQLYNQLPVTVEPAMRIGLMKCWLLANEHEMVNHLFQERPKGKPIVKQDIYITIHLIQICSLYNQFQYNKNNDVINPPSGFLKEVSRFTSFYELGKQYLPVESRIHSIFIQLAKPASREQHIKLLRRLFKKLNTPDTSEKNSTIAFLRLFALDKWILSTIHKLENIQ